VEGLGGEGLAVEAIGQSWIDKQLQQGKTWRGKVLTACACPGEFFFGLANPSIETVRAQLSKDPIISNHHRRARLLPAPVSTQVLSQSTV
jgi:hypothetical protein